MAFREDVRPEGPQGPCASIVAGASIVACASIVAYVSIVALRGFSKYCVACVSIVANKSQIRLTRLQNLNIIFRETFISYQH